jgi:hypothetical protein
MLKSVLKLNKMKSLSILSLVLLAGCAIPANDPSFRAEKTPAAAVLAGEKSREGDLSQRVKQANEKNDQRLKDGDWRAIKPAVGPQP